MRSFGVASLCLALCIPAWGDDRGYCDGNIRCSSYVSEDDPELLETGLPAGGYCGGGTDTPVVDGQCCRYGHEPDDGVCSRPCLADFNEEVCRCVTLEYQEVRNRVLAIPDLIQAVLAFVIFLILGVLYAYILKTRKGRKAEQEAGEAEATPRPPRWKTFAKFGLIPLLLVLLILFVVIRALEGIKGVLEPKERYYNGCQNPVQDVEPHELGDLGQK
jgi:hypothetical protein